MRTVTGIPGFFQKMGLEVFDNYVCDGQMELTDCTENRQLTHLSLFSGIGGLDLAAEWAGFESVGQCEWADYPTKVLEKHWPDVPRWRDIRTLNGVSFYERTNRRTVDIISGGFPCQPFSVAGKQRGEDDDRYLWPEMVRVIKDIRPSWVVGENVAGIINMALDTVLSDLEAAGYSARTFLIPACGVNAPHQRYRTAIVAYADSSGQFHRKSQIDTAKRWEQTQPESCECSNAVAYSLREHGEGTRAPENETRDTKFTDGSSTIGRKEWWSVEPGVGRVAYGIPHRVDRLKCLGNAVVPAQFYPVFQAIADIELHR